MPASHRRSTSKHRAIPSNQKGRPDSRKDPVETPVVDIYARHANEENVERQVALCRAHAETIGARVNEEHRDQGRGSSISDREGLMRMIANVKSGLITGIVVEDPDRLSRDQSDLHAVGKLCRENAVDLHTVREGKIDLLSMTFKTLMAVHAQEAMAHRASMGRQAAALAGRSSAKPFGYVADRVRPGVRHIHPERADAVRHMFETFAAGCSRVELAEWMTGRHPTPSACPRIDGGIAVAESDSRWTPAMVTALLRSPLYKGTLIYEPSVMTRKAETGRHVTARATASPDRIVTQREELRIIGDELWQRVQTRLKTTSAKSGRAPDNP